MNKIIFRFLDILDILAKRSFHVLVLNKGST